MQQHYYKAYQLAKKGLRTANNKYIPFINDIHRYFRYYGGDSFNGRVFIRFLPYSKGYDEHPYWLIKKLETILEIVNRVNDEENKIKK